MPRVFPVTCHTDHVGTGSTFVAIKGFKHDGVVYIPQAIARGANRIVVHHDALLPADVQHNIKLHNIELINVDNTRKALALLSAQALGYPARQLRIIGITGTIAKTTTVCILEHLLKKAGHKTALLSSIKNSILEKEFQASLTTPQPDYLHMFFRCCVTAGVEYVIMEVAAQALTLHRTEGIEFDGIVFTNFDQEHAEFYSSMHDYFKAKCSIFDQLKPGAPVCINADDAWCKKIINKHQHFMSFGTNNNKSTIHFSVIDDKLQGLTLSIALQNKPYTFHCPALIGIFNGYNIAGAISMAHSLGISVPAIAASLRSFKNLPGKLERYILPNKAQCFIDHAHTPSSYQLVLSLLRSLTQHLIVVFGAGGERDHIKRPIMGNIASEFADIVILTSDNPRSEDLDIIIDTIYSGIAQHNQHKIIRELNRERAIKKAYALSTTDSIIALLGKGPDEYQIIGSRKIPFSEKKIIQSL